ncbi:MAG TPA: 2-amino-3-ketobutyrate CoA ligase, partial [Polyangiaceae bacterium]|nr:2-amino-3-ketobutyrate CoA ligase [Polyangiaceae bacterium]
MGLRQVLVDKGKQALLRPSVMRWVSDDRVMKVTEGLLDARGRLGAAWSVLKNGHELPNIDPALDENIGKSAPAAKSNGASNGHVSNGHAAKDISSGSSDMDESMKERTSLASIGGKDVFEKAYKFMAADNARKMGIYPFFRPLDFNDGPEA